MARGPDRGVPVMDYVDRLLREKDLRDEQRFMAQSEAVAAAFGAAKEAVTKAEVSVKERLATMNELRDVVQAVLAQQMPRAEAEERIAAVRAEMDRRLNAQSEEVDALKLTMTQREGRGAGLSSAWGYIVGAVAVLAVLATHVNFH